MTRMDPEFQPDTKNALEDTKRGYGLWCGEVIHPANREAVERARNSDQPITDTKGLGFRYVAVWPEDGTPHFRIHEPDRYTKAVTLAASTVHDRVVALVHGLLYREGYEGLKSVCFSTDIPDTPFEFESVLCETDRVTDSGRYRPDITIIPKSKNYPVIELEVVYTHEPSEVRIARAKSVDALVLVCNIRGSVERKIFDASADMNFTDSDLLAIVKRHRFRWPRLITGRSPALARWVDLDQAAYASTLKSYVDVEVASAKNDLKMLGRFLLAVQAGETLNVVSKQTLHQINSSTHLSRIPWESTRFLREYERAQVKETSELGRSVFSLRKAAQTLSELESEIKNIAAKINDLRSKGLGLKSLPVKTVSPHPMPCGAYEDLLRDLTSACRKVVVSAKMLPEYAAANSFVLDVWLNLFYSDLQALHTCVDRIHRAAIYLPESVNGRMASDIQNVLSRWESEIDAALVKADKLRKDV
jgi:hypothetical protein